MICCTAAQADTIAERFIAETEERDEFEIEIKRNMLLECGDIVELEKPTWDGGSIVNLPCRVLESKKNLTK